MTLFEIIIIVLIYCFCYGYANILMYAKDESVSDTLIRVFISFVIAFYVPAIIGYQLGNKLNE